ncbi:copper homeostasis periplasmic binding protein CopC [Sphingomonas sp. NFR15]|uniref:copper homeostasis periplasmic binding protein CopC n=1 Tax=Sphingomonas sp. NFR15 TaxID=1566282 RepID=UPI00088205BD|nr:copper homeostasis periplasmic binding protein CopC [Sphingomonas sp. NFR15]SDA10935.1 hypothetical protein SAMN03159340_00077 [Sphingomonas sp. NFR15]
MRRLILSSAAAMLIAAPAFAHPDLVSSTPAADATVAPTNRVEITFSDKLTAQSVGATLEMVDMPGMRMAAPMKMKAATSVSTDGMTLIATTSKPLPKGTYKLTYHVASADTHGVDGDLAFTVQ